MTYCVIDSECVVTLFHILPMDIKCQLVIMAWLNYEWIQSYTYVFI